jgi:hypothetical protein
MNLDKLLVTSHILNWCLLPGIYTTSSNDCIPQFRHSQFSENSQLPKQSPNAGYLKNNPAVTALSYLGSISCLDCARVYLGIGSENAIKLADTKYHTTFEVFRGRTDRQIRFSGMRSALLRESFQFVANGGVIESDRSAAFKSARIRSRQLLLSDESISIV